MIPTLRRSRDDIFLIGEEQILTAQEAERDPDPTIATWDLGGHPSRRPSSHRLPAALHGAPGLALLGLAVGASALVALRPWDGGAPEPQAHVLSPRSPLISRSAAALPARPAARVHPPAARPAEVHRPTVVHHERPRRPEAPAPPPPKGTPNEPEREPTPKVAPDSSPVVTPTSEAAPEYPPAPTAEPPTPSPPPSSSGGGPGGVTDPPSPKSSEDVATETFGFER